MYNYSVNIIHVAILVNQIETEVHIYIYILCVYRQNRRSRMWHPLSSLFTYLKPSRSCHFHKTIFDDIFDTTSLIPHNHI